MIISTNQRSAKSNREGFTLIELSVVVTCVGLLIGLVQPSLLSARNKSKLSVCLDHLRTIGEASALYSNDDPSSMAIPIHPLQYAQDPANPTFIGAYEWGGKSGIGRPGLLSGGNSALSSKYGTAAGVGPATRPLNNYLYPHGFIDNLNPVFNRLGTEVDTQLSLDKFQCPADDGPPLGAHCPDWLENPTRSSYDHFGNSYAANLFMISGGWPDMRSNSPYLRPVTRVPNPSRVIHYEENIGRWAWAARREIDQCLWIGQGVDPGPTKGIRGWHGKNWIFNRSFVDTHAERQQVYLEGAEDSEGYANHYFNEIVFPDDPQQQIGFGCIIIRGHGWQKDTLPGELMPTGLDPIGSGRPSYEDCVNGG